MGGVDPYTGNWYGGSAGHANVLLGNGDGTFVLRDIYSLDYPTSGSSSALGDFNGDGTLDLAADGSVFLGNGDGTLRARQSGPMWAVAAAADLNADGSSTSWATASPWATATARSSPPAATRPPAPPSRVADFDGDGRPDLAATPGGNVLVVQLGNGDGTFRHAYHFAAGSGPSLTAGDFNGDRRPDVVTGGESAGTVTVLLNDGNWAAPPAPTLSIGDVTVAEGNTGTTAATFTLTLSAASARDVTVRYATADGYSWSPATAGSDYAAGSGQVTIPAGQTAATIVVPVSGDRVVESRTTDAVLLRQPERPGQRVRHPRAGRGHHRGRRAVHQHRALRERGGGERGDDALHLHRDALGRLRRAGDRRVRHRGPRLVRGATAGVDYTAAAGTLTFAAGETTKTITVLVNGDRLGEYSETVPRQSE